MSEFTFRSTVVEWRGPAPFYFVALPDTIYDEIREAARVATYGWGCVPVAASIGDHAFTTSLIPRDNTYFLPLKQTVRAATGTVLGDELVASIAITPRRP